MLKKTICATTMRPVVIYGRETWKMNQRNRSAKEIFERTDIHIEEKK